ncbi:MAG: hypothetical protein ACTSPV_18410 [Candidatus Hodarchaeales archaeon]
MSEYGQKSFIKSITFKKTLINIVISFMVYIAVFTLITLIFDLITGDIYTLVYKGRLKPTIYPYEMDQTTFDLMRQEYNEARKALGTMTFPLSIFQLMLRYLLFDFGRNMETIQPISEEILQLSDKSITLVLFGILAFLLFLSPIIVYELFISDKKISGKKDKKIRGIIKIFSIMSPMLILIFPLLFQLLAFDLKIASASYREDANIIEVLLLPVLFLSLTALVIALVTNVLLGLKSSLFAGISTILFTDPVYERIFTLPGVGRYLYRALLLRNYPVILAVTYLLLVTFLIIYIVVSLLPLESSIVHPKKRKSFLSILERIIFDFEENLFEILLICGFFGLLGFFFVVYNFAPFHPFKDDYTTGQPSYAPPGGTHIFGTDWAGQDIFSRTLFGLNKLAMSGLFGALGTLAGYLLFLTIPKKHEEVSYLSKVVFLIGLLVNLFAFKLFLSNLVGNTSTSDWFTLDLIILFLFVFTPSGFLITSKYLQDPLRSPSSLIRPILGVGAIFAIAFEEFSIMIVQIGSINQSFLGREMTFNLSFYFNYPWTLTSPLIVLCLASTLLLTVTLFPLEVFRKEKTHFNLDE